MLHQRNSYAHIFKSTLQRMPSDTYKVVIRADKRPAREHEQRFIEPVTNGTLSWRKEITNCREWQRRIGPITPCNTLSSVWREKMPIISKPEDYESHKEHMRSIDKLMLKDVNEVY